MLSLKNVIRYSDGLDYYLSQWNDPKPYFFFKNSVVKSMIYLDNIDIEDTEKEILKTESLKNPSNYYDGYRVDDLTLYLGFITNSSSNKALFIKMIADAKENEDYSRTADLLLNLVTSEEKLRITKALLTI